MYVLSENDCVDNFAEAMRVYYNCLKPHEALDGKTPSEEAGITIEGDNKWLTLMHKAVQYQKTNAKQTDQ